MNIPEFQAQINYIFTGTGLPRGAQVAFGVGNVSDDSAATIAAAVAGIYVDDIKPSCSDQVALTTIRVKKGPNATGEEIEVTVNEVGAFAGGDLTPNVALLVKKLTALGGRHGRGRMYLPVLAEASVGSGGAVGSVALAGWTTAMNSFLADLATAGYPMNLLHDDTVTDPTTVTSLVVQPLIATQRRRLRK